MKSFAVIGMGRFGTALATTLFDLGHEVLAVDINAEKVDEIADHVTQAVCANVIEPGVIAELALKDYDAAVVAIGSNLSDSILAAMMLKESGSSYVIAKAQDENHRKVLQKVGADQVIIPEFDAGAKMAARLVSDNVFDVIDISPDYSIADVVIPGKWRGKTLIQLDLRRNYGVNVIAVKSRETGSITTISPRPDYVFSNNDILVVIGENNNINAINNII